MDELPEDIEFSRITTKSLVGDFVAIMNFERGVLYTLWGLVRRPAKTIQDFFFGNRRRHAHPLRVLVFSSAIATLLTITLIERAENPLNISINGEQIENVEITPDMSEEQVLEAMAREQLQKTFIHYFTKYLNVMYLLMVPISAALCALFFYGKGFNFAEHLVVSAYMGAINNVIYVLFFTAIWFWQDAFMIYSAVAILFNFYFFMNVYKSRNVGGFFRSLGAILFTYLLVMVVVVGAMVLMLIHSAQNLGIPLD